MIDGDESTIDSIGRQCESCKRTQSDELIQQYGASYDLKLNEVEGKDMKKKQKLYNITKGCNSPVMVILCPKCITNLTMEKPPYKYSWSAFIYNLLMDKNIQKHYGEDI